jgi:hypothetical protein
VTGVTVSTGVTGRTGLISIFMDMRFVISIFMDMRS